MKRIFDINKYKLTPKQLERWLSYIDPIIQELRENINISKKCLINIIEVEKSLYEQKDKHKRMD